jgi:hypothetical protein
MQLGVVYQAAMASRWRASRGGYARNVRPMLSTNERLLSWGDEEPDDINRAAWLLGVELSRLTGDEAVERCLSVPIFALLKSAPNFRTTSPIPAWRPGRHFRSRFN